MWNCSLRVQMSSLWWLQRSVQDSYTPRVWVLSVSAVREKQALVCYPERPVYPIQSIYKSISASAVLSACSGDFSRKRARTWCQGAWSWSQWQCLDIKRFSPPTCSLHMQPSARIPVKGVGKTKADKVYLVLTAWGNQTIEWQEWEGAERGDKPKQGCL